MFFVAIAFYDGFSNLFRCFCAHGLNLFLDEYMLKVYNTGIQYHFMGQFWDYSLHLFML